MDAYPDCPKVRYEDVCGEIKTGDVFLTSGQSAMSAMIKAATDSPFSHVGLILRAAAIDVPLVLESVESIGVRLVTLTHYLYNYDGHGHGYEGRLYIARHRQVDVTNQATLMLFVHRAAECLGCLYDTRQIVRIAARIVAAKLGLPPQERSDDNSFICSEFAAVCLQAIGVDIPYHRANFITPADFATCEDVTFICEIASQ